MQQRENWPHIPLLENWPHIPLLTPHSTADDESRRAAYRDLFRSALGDAPLSELCMALNQDQPIGNDRFYLEFEAMTGQRRALRKRGRLRKGKGDDSEAETRAG